MTFFVLPIVSNKLDSTNIISQEGTNNIYISKIDDNFNSGHNFLNWIYYDLVNTSHSDLKAHLGIGVVFPKTLVVKSTSSTPLKTLGTRSTSSKDLVFLL